MLLAPLLVACVVLPTALARSALGQGSTTGAIAGRVTSPANQPIPDATVEITGTADHRGTVLHTDSAGLFLAPNLVPGTYTVAFRAEGLGSASLKSAIVRVDSTSTLNIVLRPSSVSSEVTVDSDADSDLAEDPSAALSTPVSSSELAALPTDGRRWQDFALLSPQANQASPDLGLLSFRGLAPTQNSSTVDGASDDQSFNAAPHGSGSDTDPDAETESAAPSSAGRSFASGYSQGRHPGADYTFSQAAVREFRVVGQNYSAIHGHAAGGIVATVSRAGSNDLHGSLFYLLRQSAWAAADPYAVSVRYSRGVVAQSLVKPPDHRHQFGGTLGGPVKRDRLFFFYAFDSQRRSFPAISSPENPSFYSLTPNQTALLGNRGVSSARTSAALSYLDSLSGEVPRSSQLTVNFARLDWHTDRSRATLQYNRARSSAPSGLRSATVVSRGTHSFGSTSLQLDSLLGRWLWTRNASSSNELRVQASRDRHFEQPELPLPQEPAISVGGMAPEVAIGPDGFTFGTPASVGRGYAPDEYRIQVADVATRVYRKHLLQAGLDFSYVHDETTASANTAGSFHYDSGTTGGHAGGLVDWITDFTFGVNSYPNGACPSINSPIHLFCFRSFSQTFGGQSAVFSTQEWAAFLQDHWRPLPTLAIDAGLRYEYELLPIPQQPNRAVDAVFSANAATSIFPEDRNNFGPRASVAWQPFGFGKGIVRVGYGVFFGRISGATIRSALLNTATGTTATRIRIFPTTITGCPQVANQGFGYPCAYVSAPPSSVSATTSITAFDRRFRAPMVQHASISVERELGRRVTLSASYLLNLDRQLPNSTDLNIAPASSTRQFQVQGGSDLPELSRGRTFVLPFYTQRISTGFGPITAITSNVNASYNGLVLQARHRSRNGVEFRTSYTWSKAIDFGQNLSSVPKTDAQLDPVDIRYDKALSDLNYPHKLVASAILEPVPELSSHLLQRIAEHWLLAPLLTYSSGRPYSYNIFGGSRLTGGRESINGSGGATYLPTIGRNTLRLPPTFALNARLSRGVPVSEHAQIRFSAEGFNLTNHRNRATVSERAFLVGTTVAGITPLTFQDAATIASEGLNSLPFGTVTSSAGQQTQERQLQFGVRLDF